MINKQIILELIEQKVINPKEITKDEYEKLKSNEETKHNAYKMKSVNSITYIEIHPEDLENIQSLLLLKIMSNTTKMEKYQFLFYVLAIINIFIFIIFLLYKLF